VAAPALARAARPEPVARPGGRGVTHRVACLFHLNLAFSSLAPERRAEVVARCYWPVLRLPEATGFPVAVEASGWTLERIAELDPAWLAEARRLVAAGHLELVAGGRVQAIGPLLPGELTAWNLRLGLADAERLLGIRPRVALLGEQAYAAGLVERYAEAGFAAIVADWDNAFAGHPEWSLDLRRLPQRARGAEGSVPVIWSESLAFQRFQRLAHGILPLADWLSWVAERTAAGPGALLLYANDAEAFDHRPGRFAAEPPLAGGEWERIAGALRAVVERGLGTPALPSALLDLLDAPGAGRELALESAAHPVPVKKQAKYNVARWGVTGRDDQALNVRCRRLYAALRSRGERDPEAWRELCELHASDFRTHITAERWAALQRRLGEREDAWRPALPAPPPPRPAAGPPPGGVTPAGALVRVAADPLDVVLDPRRGLAVVAFRDRRVAAEPLFGTLPLGTFETIDLGADWYSGHVVAQPPARHRVTDLAPVEPVWAALAGGGIRAWATLPTELGPVEKVLTIDPGAGTLELDVTLRWPELPEGSLRAAHVTLDPAAFDARSLFYAAHDGGRELTRHPLGDRGFDHGDAVSSLVTARGGIGLTEGVVLLGDAERQVRVEVDRLVAAPLGLVTYRPAGERFLLRLALSLLEHDDTRRGPVPRPPGAPTRLRVRLSGQTSSRTAEITRDWSASESRGKQGRERQPA